MSDFQSFQVGEKFPLPIKTQADGALFQVDSNGAIFILQLSRTDIIAIEAFRTGRMELALYEEDAQAFLLYQIDGIFKEGWGDAPFSLAAVKEELLPTEKSLADKTIHLYLVDTTLQILLAQRDAVLNDKFHSLLTRAVNRELVHPQSVEAHTKRVQKIWAAKTPAAMREAAIAVQEIPMDITIPAPPGTLH